MLNPASATYSRRGSTSSQISQPLTPLRPSSRSSIAGRPLSRSSVVRSRNGSRNTPEPDPALDIIARWDSLLCPQDILDLPFNKTNNPESVSNVQQTLEGQIARRAVRDRIREQGITSNVTYEWELNQIPYDQQGSMTYYTNETLAARKQLKNDPAVKAAIDKLWAALATVPPVPETPSPSTFVDSSQTPEPDPVVDPIQHLLWSSRKKRKEVLDKAQENSLRSELRKPGFVSKDMYDALCLRLFPYLHGRSEPRKARQVVTDDWVADSGGNPSLDYPRFYLAIFQLVDIWSDSVDVLDYCQFLDNVYEVTVLKKDLHYDKAPPPKKKKKLNKVKKDITELIDLRSDLTPPEPDSAKVIQTEPPTPLIQTPPKQSMEEKFSFLFKKKELKRSKFATDATHESAPTDPSGDEAAAKLTDSQQKRKANRVRARVGGHGEDGMKTTIRFSDSDSKADEEERQRIQAEMERRKRVAMELEEQKKLREEEESAKKRSLSSLSMLNNHYNHNMNNDINEHINVDNAMDQRDRKPKRASIITVPKPDKTVVDRDMSESAMKLREQKFRESLKSTDSDNEPVETAIDKNGNGNNKRKSDKQKKKSGNKTIIKISSPKTPKREPRKRPSALNIPNRMNLFERTFVVKTDSSEDDEQQGQTSGDENTNNRKRSIPANLRHPISSTYDTSFRRISIEVSQQLEELSDKSGSTEQPNRLDIDSASAIWENSSYLSLNSAAVSSLDPLSPNIRRESMDEFDLIRERDKEKRRTSYYIAAQERCQTDEQLDSNMSEVNYDIGSVSFVDIDSQRLSSPAKSVAVSTRTRVPGFHMNWRTDLSKALTPLALSARGESSLDDIYNDRYTRTDGSMSMRDWSESARQSRNSVRNGKLFASIFKASRSKAEDDTPQAIVSLPSISNRFKNPYSELVFLPTARHEQKVRSRLNQHSSESTPHEPVVVRQPYRKLGVHLRWSEFWDPNSDVPIYRKEEGYSWIYPKPPAVVDEVQVSSQE